MMTFGEIKEELAECGGAIGKFISWLENPYNTQFSKEEFASAVDGYTHGVMLDNGALCGGALCGDTAAAKFERMAFAGAMMIRGQSGVSLR